MNKLHYNMIVDLQFSTENNIPVAETVLLQVYQKCLLFSNLLQKYNFHLLYPVQCTKFQFTDVIMWVNISKASNHIPMAKIPNSPIAVANSYC